jgi:hypothetical protein
MFGNLIVTAIKVIENAKMASANDVIWSSFS